MKQKFYAGYSMAPQIRKLIKETVKDEFDLSIEEIEKHIKNGKYYKIVNKEYM